MSFYDTLLAKNLSGGGGNSPYYKTSSVRLINKSNRSANLAFPYIYSDYLGNANLMCWATLDSGQNAVYNVAVYNDNTFLELITQSSLKIEDVSGDAEIDGYFAIIKGDCTITFNNA